MNLTGIGTPIQSVSWNGSVYKFYSDSVFAGKPVSNCTPVNSFSSFVWREFAVGH